MKFIDKYTDFLNEGKYTSLRKTQARIFLKLLKSDKKPVVFKMTNIESDIATMNNIVRLDANSEQSIQDFLKDPHTLINPNKLTNKHFQVSYVQQKLLKIGYYIWASLNKSIHDEDGIKVYQFIIKTTVLIDSNIKEETVYDRLYGALLQVFNHEHRHIVQTTNKGISKLSNTNDILYTFLNDNGKVTTLEFDNTFISKNPTYLADQKSEDNIPYYLRKFEIDAYIEQFETRAKHEKIPFSDAITGDDTFFMELEKLIQNDSDKRKEMLTYFFTNVFSRFNTLQFRKDFVKKYKKFFPKYVKSNRNYKLIDDK